MSSPATGPALTGPSGSNATSAAWSLSARRGRTATSLQRGEDARHGVDLLLLGAGDRPRHRNRQRPGSWGFFGLLGRVRASGLGLTGPCRSRHRGAKVLIQTVASVTRLVWPRRDTRPELVLGAHRSAAAPPSGVLGRGNGH